MLKVNPLNKTFFSLFLLLLAIENNASHSSVEDLTMQRFFLAKGKVQNVMFRQTVIRAAARLKLQAGATNTPKKDEVLLTLIGEPEKIDLLVTNMQRMPKLNSWGATINALTELDKGPSLPEHQVSTDNVDSFSWNPDVELYL